MEYHYPIDLDWSTDEVINVIEFFRVVETAYEKGIKSKDVLTNYKNFKQVVPSKAEEKSLFKQFEKHSGYVPYKVVQAAKKLDEQETVSM
ncbi:UPF0223 family protein [Tenuibacillus multivorans]|uniref:UPF0223 protein SAMN05216498_1323 n=1 Tax=Tenuibacillus multivorans TaxID=237069 RepID=A0A1G9YCJ0_9BACI|nr:UPF0223 family protein [Tenuibacillus multivorans]GEL76027.1 UPF0223 protein [Tenuibacillus multivorans]SDN06376.1 Uncharacterized protein YktA, UPF0223 family [Tenuibacillus multivorans]